MEFGFFILGLGIGIAAPYALNALANWMKNNPPKQSLYRVQPQNARVLHRRRRRFCRCRTRYCARYEHQRTILAGCQIG